MNEQKENSDKFWETLLFIQSNNNDLLWETGEEIHIIEFVDLSTLEETEPSS